jgi:hypothetical protein
MDAAAMRPACSQRRRPHGPRRALVPDPGSRRPPARIRLEHALGAELARRLVAALASPPS